MIGGLGSDTFNVAGDVTARVISQSLEGRSGVINHGASSELDAGVDEKSKEIYARVRAWWLGNDSRRGSTDPSVLTSMEIANLRCLSNLLDESNHQERLVKAEILRELGEFELSLQLLGRDGFPVQLADAALSIRNLAEERNAVVRELKFG